MLATPTLNLSPESQIKNQNSISKKVRNKMKSVIRKSILLPTIFPHDLTILVFNFG